jgi:hypothetical protein
MADEIDKIASSLDGLNSTMITSGIEFKGLTKSLIVAADATSNAGKKWTVFSRLVSGSPLWAIQNKARAYLAILGGFEQRSKDNAKAQLEANKTIIAQVAGFRKLKEEYSALENQLDAVVHLNADFNESQEAAIKNTLSYSKAILLGKSEREAQIKGAEELNKKFKQQAKLYKDAEKLARREENMKTRAGRGRIKAGISSSRRSLKKQFKERQQGAKDNFKKIGETIGYSLMPLFAPIKSIKMFYNFSKKNGKSMLNKLNLGERYEKLKIKIQLKALAFQKSAQFVLNLAFKYFVFGILGMIALLGVAKIAYEMYGVLEELFILDVLKYAFLQVLDIASNFFGLVGAFIQGDYQGVIDYGVKILDNVLNLLLAGVYLVFMGAYGFLAGIFVGIFELGRALTKAETWKMLAPVLIKFGKVLLVAYFIKYLASQALLLIGIYALPLMVALLIGAILYKALKWAVDKINPFANGGVVGSSPMQIVGERGPELVSLPKGSRVYTNQQTKSMVSNRGMQVNNYITINARDTSDAELRRIADKIGNMVNNKMNRTSSTRTLG